MPKEKKPTRSSKKLQQTTLTGKPSPRKSSQPSGRPKAQKHMAVNEDVSDDSDFAAIKLTQPKAKPAQKDTGFPLVHKTRIIDSDEDEDQQSNSDPKPPRRTATRRNERVNKKSTSTKVKLRRLPSPDSGDEQPPPRKRRGRLIRHSPVVSEKDGDTSDELETEHILETRLRKRDKKTAFQKNLEKLKRRKQGKKESETEKEDSEEDSEEEEDAQPFQGAKKDDDKDSLFDGSDSGDDDSNSVGSSDFIVEDDGAGLSALPAEFSMDAHEDLAHQFKKIFQFFVHIAVRPGLERHEFMVQTLKKEDYFSLPLNVTRRKLSGLRDSLVASSVWRSDFKKTLEKYPDLDVIQLDFAVAGCDACHLGSRTSTLCGRLLGHPYDRVGFEELSSDEESVSDAGSSSDSGKKRKNRKNSEKKKNKKKLEAAAEYHLGRFCARRVRVYHDLSHWEYNLFRTITDEMDDLYMAEDDDHGFVQVAHAKGRKPPEDLEDADAICEWLDERRVIETEWQKLKDVMDRSRGLEFAAKKGETD
ncbi:hypothetical protein D9758_000581 [Tetrapyrgos nigripes]|uniref:DUF4211 domain-containing protein n=1 Tax=Tetrapyrgos nigripes TaxID=182062 RepID=A0A8H5GYW2_9AGAR|nr:hypothetical protein D9758_000581 [Tetrapyrgos nigripes]